jgi:hypothetical protein
MVHAFPSINIEWLITGNGKMYKQTPSSLFPELDIVQKEEKQQIEDTVNLVNNTSNSVTNTSTAKKTQEETTVTFDNKSEKQIHEAEQLDKNEKLNLENIQANTADTNFTNANINDISVPITDKSQEIESVLIFYTDRTFKYYKPS